MQKLRWGLIGCGDIARKRVAPALRDAAGSELYAVARAQADLAEEFAREFGARKHYGDWRELLADPEIDAIYIATPVDLHAEQTIAAARAGKHVLCEKPMALTAADCGRAAAACREAGVKLGIAYYRHFYPLLKRIKQIIASGEIGQPVIARINAFEQFNPAAHEPRHWLIEKARSGGGPMMDFGCHRIEVLMNLFGPIARTQAFQDQVRLKRDVEDTAGAFFHFESGAHAALLVSHAAFEPQDTLDIFGGAGALRVPVLTAGQLHIKTPAGERAESHPPHANLHQPLIEDFVDAIANDREPAVGAEVGREVQRIEELIYAA
jgi:predicted dehydrogenase